MEEKTEKNISEQYLKSLTLLIAGALAGLTAAFIFGRVEFDLSGELAKARSLGIVSLTILGDYAKSQDIINYLSTLIFPVLFAIGAWLAFLKPDERKIVHGLHSSLPDHENHRRWIILLVLSVVWLYVSFNQTLFYEARYSRSVGNWSFLGEEGAILAWAQNILDGGVYGRDFFCLYGPMLIYPVAWVMDIFGETVLVYRIYSHVVNLVAYGVILYILSGVLRTRTALIVAAIMAMFIFTSSSWVISPHTSKLRVALGILPLVLTYKFIERKNPLYLAIAGAVAGQSLLFSQEVGICSIFAMGVFLLFDLWSKRDFKSFRNNSIAVLGGFSISVLPMLVYFTFNGALLEFLKNIFVYPRLVSMGYGSLPFPPLETLFINPFGVNVFFPYWIIFLYVLVSIVILTRLVMKQVDRRLIFMSAILAFGIVLFRVALGRSGEDRTLFSLLPAFVLMWMLAEDAVLTAINNSEKAKKVGSAVLAFVLLSSFSVVCVKSYKLNRAITKNANSALTPGKKLDPGNTEDDVLLTGRGGGVYVKKSLHDQMELIEQFLNENTQKDEPVYFFPLEPAYYFLFERKNPTRYPLSYFAITFDQQRELIEDLKTNLPRYIVYSTSVWRVDNIMENTQIPLVFDYIRKSYSPVLNENDIVVLKKN